MELKSTDHPTNENHPLAHHFVAHNWIYEGLMEGELLPLCQLASASIMAHYQPFCSLN